MSNDFLSDDEMGQLEANHASAPDFIPDEEMDKVAPPPLPPENPDDLVPFVKTQVHGLVDFAKRAGKGVATAFTHPLDTAKDAGNWMLEAGGPGGDQGNTLINERAVRNLPLVGTAINNIGANAAGLGALASGEPSGDRADAAFRQAETHGDAAHAQEHPLTDFIQKSAGLAALPAAMVPQIAALATDAFQRSLADGDDALTAMKHARNTAVLAGTALAAGKAISKAPGLIGRAAAKEAGVSEESIARYRENPEAVNAAAQYVQDPEALKNLVDSKVAPVKEAFDTARGDFDASLRAVQDAKGEVSATSRQPPMALASEIPGHLDQAGDQLSKMSGESFDILNDEGHTFRTEDMAAAVKKQMRSLRIGGVEPTIGPDAAAYNALGQFKKMIDDMGENAERTTGDTEVPARVVKQLIQTLDNTSKAAYGINAGALGPEAATNLAQVRGALNGALRDASPAYAAKMDELAPQVRLVADMSKVFGNEQSSIGALRAAANPQTPKGYVVRQMLAKYDAAHGTDFAKQVTEYYDQPRGALEQARSAADAAQSALEDRRVAAANVDKLGIDSTENTVKAIQGGRNFEARKQLEALSPETAQTVQDAGVAKQFAKSTTNGSRKAKIGAGVGGAVGAATGGFMGGTTGAVIGGHLGAAAGGVLGGLADQYGGQAVKTALDAGIRLDRLAETEYIGPIMEAAQRGPRAVAVAHYIWAESEPAYQRLNLGEQDDQKPGQKATIQPAGMQIDNDDDEERP